MADKHYYDSHRERAEAENIDFLLNTCGLHRDHVARRLGITRNALDKKIERSRRAQPDTSSEQATGEAAGKGPMPPLRLVQGG